jgi:hypothetical protein
MGEAKACYLAPFVWAQLVFAQHDVVVVIAVVVRD